MKKILAIALLVFLIFYAVKQAKPQNRQTPKQTERNYTSYAEEALLYCKNKKLCTDFFILIDYSIHSGKKRMFVWDFEKSQITERYLVSHGAGKLTTASDESKQNPVFSNQPNSHCSSLGKYLIAKKKVYSPSFKEKYLLYGQDATNSNALQRDVVLHPWDIIPDTDPYPQGVPESWGCPAVSPSVFEKIDKKIQTTSQNVLLWVIYPK